VDVSGATVVLTKLTLSAEKDVVEKAKLLALEQRTSVSALFSRFVRSTAADKPGLRGVGRLTRKATGIITLPSGKTDRQILEEALLDKHGLRR
jgi:hypothetical protein